LRCAGFAIHQMGVGGFGHKIPSPAGVFTALRHIAEVIQPLDRSLILTDSLSSMKAMLSIKIVHQTHPRWCMNVNNCAGTCARTELR
jgi:hypothetical protein